MSNQTFDDQILRTRLLPALLVSTLALSLGGLAACSSSSDDDEVGEAETFAIGGEVSGLGPEPLVLELNGDESLTIDGDGAFSFDTELEEGETYQVLVETQPDGQECTVENGGGTVADADVDDIQVNCEDLTYSVGGEVSGLNGSTAVLELNSDETLSLDDDGPFAFNTELGHGEDYTVAVESHPDEMVCELDNETGTIDMADVDDVMVTCEALNVGASSKRNSVVLDWDRAGDVDILFSTDPECDWSNVTSCDNGGMIPAASGGEHTLTVEDDGLQADTVYAFVKQVGGGLSAPAYATPMTYELSGTVNDTAISGGVLYVGGDFESYGPRTGGMAMYRLDKATAEMTGPKMDVSSDDSNGIVYAVVEDPNGGWFVGGAFDTIQGEPRENLARLNADGSLDQDWDVPAPGSFVFAMAVSDDRLYVGGSFDSLAGDSDYQHVGALELDGSLDTAFDASEITNTVRSMVLDGDDLYLGGHFTDNVTALNAGDGSPIDLFDASTDGPVWHVSRHDDRLFVGGLFGQANGEARSGLAAFEVLDGILDDFDADISGMAVTSVIGDGDDLIIGGWFEEVGGAEREAVARVDQDTGAVRDDWSVDMPEGAIIYDLALHDGMLYIAGENFSYIGDERLTNFARVEAGSGEPDGDWNPVAVGLRGHEFLISGETMLAFGNVDYMGGYDRPRLASFSLVDFGLTDWNPVINDGEVRTIAPEGSTVYVGGSFSQANGVDVGNAVAFTQVDGDLDGWNPSTDGPVNALVLKDDGNLYMGGEFTEVAGQSWGSLTYLDGDVGQPFLVNDPELDGPVYTIAKDSPANAIAVGGSFSESGGSTRENAAFFDDSDLTLRNWTPDPDGTVHAIATNTDPSPSHTTFLAGGFQNIAGESQEYFAQIDGNSELADATGAAVPMRAVSYLGAENRLLLGWEDGYGVLTVDDTDVTLNNNNVNFTDGWVETLSQDEDHIVLGGDFRHYDGQLHGPLVVLDADTLEPVWPGPEAASMAVEAKSRPSASANQVGHGATPSKDASDEALQGASDDHPASKLDDVKRLH
ncbi:delta-60 repeat domain-containing protein [Natronospira sp.]